MLLTGCQDFWASEPSRAENKSNRLILCNLWTYTLFYWAVNVTWLPKRIDWTQLFFYHAYGQFQKIWLFGIPRTRWVLELEIQRHQVGSYNWNSDGIGHFRSGISRADRQERNNTNELMTLLLTNMESRVWMSGTHYMICTDIFWKCIHVWLSLALGILTARLQYMQFVQWSIRHLFKNKRTKKEMQLQVISAKNIFHGWWMSWYIIYM